MRHQLATFKLDDCLYGIDVSRVQEALRMQAHTPVPHAPKGVAGLVNLRGQVVLLVDLRVRLGREAFGEDDEPMMMVVKVDGEPVSLLVDQVGDVLEIDASRYGSPPPTLEPALRDFVTGVYSLDDDLLLALDVDLAAQV
ncbi:chemotaxis protein CheW [Demequina iriomotensis]|uniref:chemotaxis protein CheW n=1 Tax=Demequina iriomotensis TaxID=1536641 RepID=UPI000780675A|nr:chemotaxis protein CheW [Demequina iriomotensis]